MLEKNILLIGKTGSGKSTLANVLINKNDKFEEVFKEGKYGVSETKEVHTEEFEHQGINYRIIDTVGFSNTKEGTKLSLKAFLYNFVKVSRVVKDGLSQILLVTNGKNWEQEILLYNSLKETVFDDDIVQHTTIIRTRFTDFEEEEDCTDDRKTLLKEGGKLAEIVEKGSIIYVDNPPVYLIGEGKRAEQQRQSNMETRQSSRKTLLEHLTACKGVYKPANLDKLNEILNKEWKEKEILKGKITKEFAKHIRERGSNLKEEEKKRLEKMWSEIEKKERGQTVIKENELSKQIGNQLNKELKELTFYLPENERFADWKKRINQLEREIVEDKERKLVGEIIINKASIIETLRANIEEKKKHLQELSNNHEGKIKGITKKNKKFLNVSSLLGGEQSENWIQKNLEEISKAQIDLTKSEMRLEIIEKILARIEDCKEQLERQLEAKVEQRILIV